MLDNVYFLVGSMRSGTSLLRLMLNHHSEIAWCSDFEYCVSQLPKDGWPNMTEYLIWVKRNRVYQMHHDQDGMEIRYNLSYPELMDDLLVQRRGNKRLVGANIHKDFDRLPRIWPTAKFIHLMRDGRDVAYSTLQFGWAGNTWVGSDIWIKAEKLWEDFRKQLKPEQYLELKYEDFINDPPSMLRAVCNFMRVPFETAMLNYPKNSTYEPPDKNMIAQWKRKQAPHDIQLLEAKIGPMLVERGYVLSGLPEIAVSPKMQRKLIRESGRLRRKFRINRFGFWLLLCNKISLILRIDPLQIYFQTRINRITNKYVK